MSKPDATRKKKVPAARRAFRVVGIGASAGGLDSMRRLLKALPPQTGMAFVIVQHLERSHPSHNVELLGRVTAMPVLQIKSGQLLRPDHVYVLPHNAQVQLHGSRFKLTRRPAKSLHKPIDIFLASLAAERRNTSIGVVLSGTGSDGTHGLGLIKKEGGLTFAEAEDSARYWEMPRSAIESGCIDSVLSAEVIAHELVENSRRPCPRPHIDAANEPGCEFNKILQIVKHHTGVAFLFYKKSTLQRRIARRMALKRVHQLGEYLEILRADLNEVDALFNDMLIHVTSFFRDTACFKELASKTIPHLVRLRHSEGGSLRVWVPGCSTGEEVYSLGILLLEEMEKTGAVVKVQIFGTDLSEAAIAKARAGFYTTSALHNVSAERLRRFFHQTAGGYQVRRSVRDLCTFARQNLCEDPPFSKLDLVSCRNLLIYLGPELQKRCIPIFHYALKPGGFLVLGNSESIGSFTNLFRMTGKNTKIYATKTVPRPTSIALGLTSPGSRTAPPKMTPPHTPEKTSTDLQRQADLLILNRFAPAGVIIDEQMQVLHFRGQTGPYLEHNSGEASLNLMQMARPGLVADLRTLVHKAIKEQTPVRKEHLPLSVGDQVRLIDLEILPLKLSSKRGHRSFLVLFIPALSAPTPTPPFPARSKGSCKVEQDLREELRATKEELESIIEELEASNEELKSANEEIESSNEELQSTNEELETAKEELQSTNEELQTLNEELNNRNGEMAQANNDLHNLLASIQIPIVMVDSTLTIRRITPLARDVFNLVPSDIGRRFSDIKSNLDIANLEKLIGDVIETLQTCERPVRDKQGRWYSLRIRPYRTQENIINGAVLTLVDIDDLKKDGESELGQHIARVTEAMHEPVIVLNNEFKALSTNACFRELFKAKKAQLKDMPIMEFAQRFLRKADCPSLQTWLEQAFYSKRSSRSCAFETRAANDRKHILRLHARRLDGPSPCLVVSINKIPAP